MTRKAIRITVAGIVVAILAAAALYRTFGYAAAVETVALAEGAVPVTIKGPGTVQARIPVTLSARITATVTKLHADQGDAVKRGQLLAMLDDRDLAASARRRVQSQETARRNIAAAQAAVAKAEAELELARTKHRRDQDLLRAGYVSQSVMDSSAATLRSAEANLENAQAALAARQAETGRRAGSRVRRQPCCRTRALPPRWTGSSSSAWPRPAARSWPGRRSSAWWTRRRCGSRRGSTSRSSGA